MKAIAESGDLSKKIKKGKKTTTMESTPDSVISTSNPVPTPTPEPTPTPAQAMPKEFMELLNRKLLENLGNEIRSPKQKKATNERISNLKDLKTLEAVVSEFLKTFIIIGYTFKGEKVTVGHATSQQENDSLSEHLRQMFLRVVNNED